ncbi:protein FAR1-RELATED SEQUENCE 5-like [Olea europaea var. sylvestris]|uniref:protein FAR1-RELATED SEQUENCE 5-like n=1 Tax=Olea europaea var. sylvestris TaxID=158386 RepID=UPI000C1D50C5|nr:protein FAR1-RELATED SEQUENCE 5-like [Olea europaea var. sylvestris]
MEHNMNVVEEETLRGDEVIVPEVGTRFKDENEVFDFYKLYAYNVGFPMRKMNSLKPQPTIQTGCKARISASADNHGYWRINTFEVNDTTEIPLHKSFNSAVVEAGGYENMICIEKDCRNYIEQVRRLSFGEGDAPAIQSNFSDMQARFVGFYFCIDLDDDSRLKNVFWANNRCRESYKEFGDVVTFDTTYLTKRYDMPFAPFVGVNQHGQSALFNCSLVCNENTDTFV